jgi:hypothetical protein
MITKMAPPRRRQASDHMAGSLAPAGYQNVRQPPKTRSHRLVPPSNRDHWPQKLAILNGRARDPPAMRVRVASPNRTPYHDVLPLIHSRESGTAPTSGLNRSSNDTFHPPGRKGRGPMAYRPRHTPAIHTRQRHRSRGHIPVSATTRTGYLEPRKENLRSSPQGGNRGLNSKQTTRLTGRGGSRAVSPRAAYAVPTPQNQRFSPREEFFL